MEHLTVSANGAAFHVARTGMGKPLLLRHGCPEFWLTWEPVMARLADRFTLLAPDLRGFGDSDKPGGPFGPDQHAVLFFFDFVYPGIGPRRRCRRSRCRPAFAGPSTIRCFPTPGPIA